MLIIIPFLKGIIGPSLVRAGICHGVVHEAFKNDPKWHKVVDFTSFNITDPKNSPSPRDWLLWPGVLIMIATSFTELGVQYKLIWHALKCAWRAMAVGTNDIAKRRLGHSIKILEKSERIDTDEYFVEDIAGPEDQVAMWMWAPPLSACVVVSCVVLKLQYVCLLLSFRFHYYSVSLTDTFGRI